MIEAESRKRKGEEESASSSSDICFLRGVV